MKLLILGLVALATVDLTAAELDPYQWNPLPVDDAIVKQALDAKKSQIVLDVIQKYPDITHDPIFNINSAEKMTSVVKTIPATVLYRLNLTLSILKPDPFNSKFIGKYTPIVSFNVTIFSLDFPGHPKFTELKYDGIDLPHVKPISFHSLEDTSYKETPKKPSGYIKVPSNDTGLWIAITALQDQIWKRLEDNKEKIIPRPNATSAPKDDFAPSNSYAIFKFYFNTTTGKLESSYSLPLFVLATGKDSSLFSFLRKPKIPVKIWVTLVVVHNTDSAESFYLKYFDFVDDPLAEKAKKDDSSSSSPLLSLNLISPGPEPSKADYLGDPAEIDINSRHIWTVFDAVKKDVLKLLRTLYWRVTIPDEALFVIVGGQVQYKNNHGDLDAPIVREIKVLFTVKEPFAKGEFNVPALRTILNTTVLLQESIDVVKGSSSFDLLKVDSCEPKGVCAVPY